MKTAVRISIAAGLTTKLDSEASTENSGLVCPQNIEYSIRRLLHSSSNLPAALLGPPKRKFVIRAFLYSHCFADRAFPYQISPQSVHPMCLVLPHRRAINCKLILQNFRHFFPVHCKMCSTLQQDFLCVNESMTASPLTSVTFYTGCPCSNVLNIRSVYLSISAFTRQLHCI